MDKVKPYYKTIEDFMAACEPLNVRGMVLVALTDGSDKDETHDVISGYNMYAFELMEVAGLLQLHANRKYLETNTEEEQDSETK